MQQRKRSSTCSIAAECSWPGRMSTPPPVGQTSPRWQGKRRRRSRRSCRANHPRRQRQDKIALSPSGGSGSTGCGAGCSSRQWRGRWSRRSRRLHRGQSQLQPQLPGSFAPSVESKFVLINTFPTSFDIFLNQIAMRNSLICQAMKLLLIVHLHWLNALPSICARVVHFAFRMDRKETSSADCKQISLCSLENR